MVYIVVSIGQRLLPLVPFTLYGHFTNAGLGPNVSKHAFDIQEMVAPVSNSDMVLFFLIVTGKFVAYVI